MVVQGRMTTRLMVVRVGVALFGVVIVLHSNDQRTTTLAMKLQPSVDRRHVLQSAVLGASSLLSQEWMIPKPPRAASSSGTLSTDGSSFAAAAVAAAAAGDKARFEVYQVFPDASAKLNPTLAAVDSLPSFATKTGALWLGEHHNSVRDHNLQAKILRGIHLERQKETATTGGTRTTAIGLEQVQVKFQPVLDDYVSGKISAATMRQRVEWETRWSWPFAGYEPIFQVAREFQIPLLALNVNSEDLAVVEKKGLPGLSPALLESYIVDRSGFASFARTRSFSSYVDYVIRPSYEIHQSLGLLKRTNTGEMLDAEMPFRTFLSGRLLWDEAMACRAHAWTLQNPSGLLVGLVGADHVKFQNGIPARYARLAAAAATGEAATSDCITVLLNPTLIDTRPPGTVEMDVGAGSSRPDLITLQLRYYNDGIDIKTATPEMLALPSSTGGVLPLADYLVIG
jgi:uncharacterized iron-regulated protein